MNTYIKSVLLVSALGMMLPATSIFAEDQAYGWQLMSEQEREAHRTKMQSMNTAEEKERYRLEHHKKMEKRAAQQGVTLPDRPQQQGGGMGQGDGMGSGHQSPSGGGGGRGR